MCSSGFSKGTIDTRSSLLKPFLRHLEANGIESIYGLTNRDVSDYCSSDRFSGREPGGVRDEHQQLRSFLRWASDSELTMLDNLALSVPTTFLARKRDVACLTDGEVEALLSDFPKSKTNLRDKAAFSLAVFCGLRKCDIVQLKFASIDFERHMLNVRQQKTGVGIELPLPPAAENALIDYILRERPSESGSELVFLSSVPPFGPVKSDFSIGRRLGKIGIAAGRKGMHSLRRTFASKLLKVGTPVSVISASLGHTDRDVVNRYLSTDEESLKACSLEIDWLPPFDPKEVAL